jgi:hypothetical protein
MKKWIDFSIQVDKEQEIKDQVELVQMEFADKKNKRKGILDYFK